jgi:hypothetical protein
MEIPRHWRLKAQRYRLEGAICPNCGELMFPPRPVCLHCHTRIARGADWELPVLQTSISKTEISSYMRYQTAEQMIG